MDTETNTDEGESLYGAQLLYSVPAARKKLSIGNTMCYSLMESGALKSVKVGRRRMIRASDLQAFVDSLTGGELSAQ